MRLLWQQIANTTVSRILCSTNMDGIVLDCEHGYFNPETLVNCIEIINLANKMCFLRFKYNEQMLQLAKDSKCHGVIIADVQGELSLKTGVGLTRENFWGRFPIGECGRPWITIAQIESLKGFNELARTGLPGFDYYMLTQYDFSNALGIPGQINSIKYQKRETEFMCLVPKEKRAAHLVKNIATDYEKYKDYGLKCFSLDTLMLLDSIKELDKYA